MKRDVEFEAEGTTLRGWLYLPEEGAGPRPGIVMTHGYTAVKEMGLPQFGDAFAAAGFACLIYDHRNTGASDGEPRSEIDPVAQARDYRHAITYLGGLSEVDEERVGIWGTSYSGAEVLQVAAVDRRVKCVVSQTMMISGYRNTLRLMNPTSFDERLASVVDDRVSQVAGADPAKLLMTSDDPGKPHAFAGSRTFRFFTGWGEEASSWRNECTVRSLDMMLEYDVTPFMSRISPTPLLMIVAQTDASTPADEALAAYELAHEPKKLVLLPGDHYSGYSDDFEQCCGAAVEWFSEHLLGAVEPVLSA